MSRLRDLLVRLDAPEVEALFGPGQQPDYFRAALLGRAGVLRSIGSGNRGWGRTVQ
jgi:hypothetical protein